MGESVEAGGEGLEFAEEVVDDGVFGAVGVVEGFGLGFTADGFLFLFFGGGDG